MAKNTQHEAAIPNPALEPLSVLVGEWNTVGMHPLLPGITLHGHVSFQWLEGGAFLIMHSEVDEPEIPSGIAIFGYDHSVARYTMIYFDERGVSRVYEMTFSDNVWKYWRNAPDFSQRFTGTFADEGNTIISKGEFSKNGSHWEGDLELTYTRVK